MRWKKWLGDLWEKKGAPSLEDLEEIPKLLHKLDQWLRDFLSSPPEVEVFTYREAVEYFVNARPSDPAVRRGALLVLPHDRGQLVLLVFLNESNDLLPDNTGKTYGRRVVSKELDEELAAALAGKSLLIFE